MKTYKITWEIELDANNPEEAAQDAMISMSDGTAKCYEVKELKTGAKFLVDLCDPINERVTPIAE